MNHFWTGQGPYHANLHKWGLAQSSSCDCGQRQTMKHSVVPVNKIWKWTESTARSGWWHSHIAGIYSDYSTCEIIIWSNTSRLFDPLFGSQANIPYSPVSDVWWLCSILSEFVTSVYRWHRTGVACSSFVSFCHAYFCIIFKFCRLLWITESFIWIRFFLSRFVINGDDDDDLNYVHVTKAVACVLLNCTKSLNMYTNQYGDSK